MNASILRVSAVAALGCIGEVYPAHRAIRHLRGTVANVPRDQAPADAAALSYGGVLLHGDGVGAEGEGPVPFGGRP